MTEALQVEAPDVAILRDGTPIDLVEEGGSAVALAWPGTGSFFRSMHRIELEPGGRTRTLRHPGEAVYFVWIGDGTIGEQPLKAHDMVYVPRRTTYAVSAASAMLVVGGPCPPDPALYRRAPADDGGAPEGQVRVFDADREGEPLPMIGKQVRLVVWPGVGAEIATMNFAVLEPAVHDDLAGAGQRGEPGLVVRRDRLAVVLEARRVGDPELHHARTPCHSVASAPAK